MACLFPYIAHGVPVPCGRCPPCVTRRAAAWGFRVMKEEERAVSSMWVTLTYSNDEVPLTERGYMTLRQRDVQLFFKNFRKAHPTGWPSIKYYGCGEYGAQLWRPHYHICILNGLEEHLFGAWVNRDTGAIRGDVFIDPRPLSHHAVLYTAYYMSKPKRVPEHRFDDRKKEFTFMSKKLGSNYISDDIIKYHNADLSRNFLTVPGGYKIALPRYYRDRIYDRDARDAQSVLIEAAALEQQNREYAEYLSKHGNGANFFKDRELARGQYMKNYFKKSKR